MKVGIFFGGRSREREISFAGGRTVYDNLDKGLFEPVPIFVDSLGNFVLLDWQYLYKGSIRDFYPPNNLAPVSDFFVYIESLGTLHETQLEHLIGLVGQRIHANQFPQLFDVAFLTLHGPYGEDGSLQGLMEWYQIPYVGTGILGAALGMNKVVQRQLMEQLGWKVPRHQILYRKDWQSTADKAALFEKSIASVGLPMVVKSACQGSSIGVSIIKEKVVDRFIEAVNRSLFIQEVEADNWLSLTTTAQQQWIHSLIDLREGIGLPVTIKGKIIHHPDDLLKCLNNHFSHSSELLQLESIQGEEVVLLETYLKGQEFSCVVLEATPGEPLALPPTEIIKGTAQFDYRAKYLPGMVRYETPIQLPPSQVHAIREACVRLFQTLEFQVYARIDGFFTTDRKVYLNDPNTTAGMHLSSFLFHQAAEVGLNPTQLLTFLIRTSLIARINAFKMPTHASHLLANLDLPRSTAASDKTTHLRVGVIMGGFSAERHISLESGRNIYAKLASSAQYTPIPIFLSGTPEHHRLFILPINMLLKNNADDIHMQLLSSTKASCQGLTQSIRQEVASITCQYTEELTPLPEELSYATLCEYIDFAFIALHGRPGEDGTLQAVLEEYGLPYNGSGIQSIRLTIDKYLTNQLLHQKGIRVAQQVLIAQENWVQDQEATIQTLETQLSYPLIAKPVDEGCSAAVIKIQNRAMLTAYANATFRTTTFLATTHASILNLHPNTEFLPRSCFLVEALVEPGDANQFLEITGGLLTHWGDQGKRKYEIFTPSEVLAAKEVLSLEEKFLEGEGQNITPARFHPNSTINQQITDQVKQDLEKVARILDLEGYARIDAFVKVSRTCQVETWIIEINALPGMTPGTCIFHQCALHGYKPLDFIQAIIQYGLQRHAEK